MSLLLRFFLPLLLLGSGNEALGQWLFDLKNTMQPTHNVDWLLEFRGEVNTPRMVTAEIRMREPGSYRDVFRKSLQLPLGPETWFRVPLNLPTSLYECEVEIYDPLTNESQLLRPESVFMVSKASEVTVSDITLSLLPDPKEAMRRPLLSEYLPAGTDTVYYFMTVRSTRPQALRSEAFFYERVKRNGRNNNDILLFASLQESVETISISAYETRLISGKIATSKLPEGVYLLDMALWIGEREPIQETESFTVGSNLSTWIAANLDDAVRMMKYLVPEETVNDILDSPTKELRQIEFTQTWEDLYKSRSKEEMERYYSRIMEANSRFGAPDKGWDSDRGKVFMLYGPPEREEKVQIRGLSHLRWVYPKWSLAFLFEERNQSFLLVQ